MSEFDMQAGLDRVAREPEGGAARILRAAEDLFAERGYDAVRTRDIARAAGVNVSTLHFHWRSKQTLYEAVGRNLDRIFLAFVARINKEAEEREVPVAEQMDRWVEWSTELMRAHPAIGPLTLHYLAGGGPPETPEFHRHNVGILRIVERELVRRLPPEVAHRADPMLLVLLVFYGATVVFSAPRIQNELLGGSPFENEEVVERLKRFGRRLLHRMLELE